MTSINEITHILEQAKEAQWPYPKTFTALEKAGVTSYEVNLEKYEATYCGTFGKWKKPVHKFSQTLKVADKFSRETVQDTLNQHHQPKTNYIQWFTGIAEGGVSHYHVNMKDRTVTYYDKDERNNYVECIPQ